MPELLPEESVRVTISVPPAVRVAATMKTPFPDESVVEVKLEYDDRSESVAVTDVLPRSNPATTIVSPELTEDEKIKLTVHEEPRTHCELAT